jgi:diadenylate cyclase
MKHMLSILYTLPQSGWHGVVVCLDLILVFILLYRVLLWIKNTHSGPLVRGLLVVMSVYFLSKVLGLMTLNWILEKLATALIFIAIIIFQPELRRFLERIGSGQLFSPLIGEQRESKGTSVIKHLLKAVELLSKEKIGALIVIEVGTNLSEYIDSGIQVRSHISAELLSTLFWPKSPTHDGAVVIRENKIEAAGCLLPLTDTPLSDGRLGTRHRAAIGLSKLTDAVVIVVSEESGAISLAENGNLNRFLNREALETRLFNLYKEEADPSDQRLFRFFKQS